MVQYFCEKNIKIKYDNSTTDFTLPLILQFLLLKRNYDEIKGDIFEQATELVKVKMEETEEIEENEMANIRRPSNGGQDLKAK